VKINVTANDIRLGNVEKGDRSVTHCAVARALRRRFPKSDIRVGFASLSIGNKHGTFTNLIMRKIMDIMNHLNVKPFSFELPKLNKW
jgi:hypothetical protein